MPYRSSLEESHLTLFSSCKTLMYRDMLRFEMMLALNDHYSIEAR